MASPKISLRGVTKAFGPKQVLRGIDFDVAPAESVVVIGGSFSAPPTGGYQPMEWPEGYWPRSPEPPTAHAWDECVQTIRSDREKFEALLTRPEADLYKPFRWGNGQNLLREALLIADHTAYHLGELIVLRRLLGAWHK